MRQKKDSQFTCWRIKSQISACSTPMLYQWASQRFHDELGYESGSHVTCLSHIVGASMSKVLCESTEREMWQISSLIMKLKRYFSLVTNSEKRKNAEFLIVIRPQTLGLSTVMLFHYDFLTSPSPLPYPSWAPPPPPPLKYHILHTFINTSPKLLTKRICLTIRSFLSWWSFPIFLRS